MKPAIVAYRYILDSKVAFTFVDVCGGEVSGRTCYHNGSAVDLDLIKDEALVLKVISEGERCIGVPMDSGQPVIDQSIGRLHFDG